MKLLGTVWTYDNRVQSPTLTSQGKGERVKERKRDETKLAIHVQRP